KPLEHVMNRAITTASKNRVAPRRNGMPRFFCGTGGVAGNVGCDFYSSLAQHREHTFNLGASPLKTTARGWIVQDQCFTHDVRLPLPPLPHSKHGALRDGVSELACQHSDLAAVVSIVRDEVAEEGSDVRPKAFNAAIRCD